MEKEHLATQEQIIQALAFGVIFLVLISIGLILFFYYSRQKLIEKEQEKLDLKLNQQKEIVKASLKMQEQERKRIAQDLHDAISAKLNVVNLTTHVLLEDETMNVEQKEYLDHILNVTSNTLESSRRIAHELMPPILEKFGLKVALEELIDDFTKSKKLAIDHDINTIKTSSNEANLHIFRIIQELINNSVRHGKANALNITITPEPSGFVIDYKDNGSGFDPEKVSINAGIGLQNISSRVSILNGTLNIKSDETNGSQFLINCINHD